MQSSYSLNSSRRTLSVPSLQESPAVTAVTLEARSTRKGRHGQPPPSSQHLLFGSWKGIPVMLRLCEKNRLIDEWDNQVIEEMRLVRALNNDNLLKVYGAVIEPAHLSIVNEYCSKGTLQDVLLGGSIKLEWLFRFSLINDIVSGISYLHTTVLTYHGRLSSACCYVNGKFVLKIGDYGLPIFYAKSRPSTAGREPTNEEMKAQYYTAPEVLQYPSQKGSQEGDVYAFAIILQEVILREEAYSMYSFDPKEILWRVRKTDDFRPKIDAKEQPECPDSLLALMEQCWARNPLERPRFPQIKLSLRQITK
ncbi:hypothetical protein RvY_18092-1 [Ramazzottius varieornatus]|uniref:guanylate cyclase n=1 Tax=Ramazzottius varieornatus TaxID=947166 RepID=A0A1D1W811_RAMVA|nr:hypothetical protein RvY_18092-1 [Ramazzottius varieornatus]